MTPSLAPDRPGPRIDHHPRRRGEDARAPRAANADSETVKPRLRSRASIRDDGGYDEFFAGRKLLKALDVALALRPSARNRALTRIVLAVDAGIAQDRTTDFECMAPDLSALTTQMARDGVDDETRHSALEFADALQHLAQHVGLDERCSAELESFAERLRRLP